MLENVKGFLTMEQGYWAHWLRNTVEAIVNRTREVLYQLYVKVLDAADRGSPRSRQRVYFILNSFLGEAISVA